MYWLGAADSLSMVATRAIHFAATATVAGNLLFRVVVAPPALASQAGIAKPFRAQARRVAWIGLAITVLSGVIWLLLQASSMSGLPFREAATLGVLRAILNDTQFGQVSQVRGGLAIVVAACLAYDRFPLANWLALTAASCLAAAIAWTGHAASTPGAAGNLHLAADALHILAAAGWIGGLVSLVPLFATARRLSSVPANALARDAARRFSTLGILSVTILVSSGIINTWILVGSFHALLDTEYGLILIFKIMIFAVMLAFAVANRFRLTPRLDLPPGNGGPSNALRQLTRNSVLEIALGLAVFAVVGMLGTQHPAIHVVN
jgi:putative copper resistance protein D